MHFIKLTKFQVIQGQASGAISIDERERDLQKREQHLERESELQMREVVKREQHLQRESELQMREVVLRSRDHS